MDHELLDPSDAGKRWPGVRFDTAVVHHRNAGRLHADRSVVALQHAAALAGADVRFGVAVRGLRPVPDGIEVVTDRDVVRAKFAPAVGELVAGPADGTAVAPELFRFGTREEAVVR
ncbi:FAD-dependent oxidoreductase [Rhodococcus artemisiae]|uniref:FAD-dependent oxidoreductase n=1 Tax=Rhodococcus artemisiae TaxID=714159 RepID=A0ABU7L9Q9_9NOCA|nr:FAD-dependent oxidoreductase [Rhodococcus artemisiae]MEE2058280.1 FAD-dependent oxidoreductase [Rhodococcus artemisiae]